MNVNIRLATVEDLTAICELAEQSLRLHYQHAPQVFAPPPGIERDREFWLSLIQAQYACFWVAEQQQQVLGFCFARLLPAGLSFLRNRLLCHISTVVVDNRAQRQGIGANLVQAVERWAKQQRAAEVRLEVFDFNAAAIALYAKQGFHTQSHIMTKLI
jgi:ribosomal protein S18 acetylase RimI-like enzyme